MIANISPLCRAGVPSFNADRGGLGSMGIARPRCSAESLPHSPLMSSPRTVTDGREKGPRHQQPCTHETRGTHQRYREEYRTCQDVAALAPDSPVRRKRRLWGVRLTALRPMKGLPGGAVCKCPKSGSIRQRQARFPDDRGSVLRTQPPPIGKHSKNTKDSRA